MRKDLVRFLGKTRVWSRLSRAANGTHNVLEFLRARGFPDAALTLLIASSIALTLSPYLGGRSIVLIGSSTATIPTVSAQWFWSIVLLAPVLWAWVLVRLIRADWIRIVATTLAALSLGVVSVVLHILNPKVALAAIDANYDKTFVVQGWWRLKSPGYLMTEQHNLFEKDEAESVAGRVCYFRVDRINVASYGYATLPARVGAFDLHVLIADEPLFPSTLNANGAPEAVPASTQNIASLRDPPFKVHAKAHATMLVTSENLRPDQGVAYTASFDFVRGTTEATPALMNSDPLARDDIRISNDAVPSIQIGAWSLWGGGSPSSNWKYQLPSFDLPEFIVRVSGRKHCNPW